MDLFKISGKFELNGKWSHKDFDFTGYFFKEKSNVIKGYVKEANHTPGVKMRYINGIFIEDENQLVFVKMCNHSYVSPQAYVFIDISRGSGYWDSYSRFGGFFVANNYQGEAQIKIEKVIDDENYNNLNRTIDIFSEMASNPSPINKELMDEIDSLKDFVVESGHFSMNVQ